MKNRYWGLVALTYASAVFGQTSVETDPIYIKEKKNEDKVNQKSLSNATKTSDSLKLLEMNSSLSFQKAGGMSSLPVIHGMASDRINIKIDGGQITASCPNHMNPALSYIDPYKVSEMELIAGVTPVSIGGDSIGGSIVVNSKKPAFATTKEVEHRANFTQVYKSNNQTFSSALSYEFAKKDWAISYQGNEEKAKNYKAGDGEVLKATRYNQNNQSITIAKKIDEGMMSLKVSHTIVPYQGYANQFMDLLGNTGTGVNFNYLQGFENFVVDAAIFHQHVSHYMNQLKPDRDGEMPMYTRSDESGYNLKVDYQVSANSKLKFGNELVLYRLDDWWPSVDGSMMMGPGTFENINNGKRDRVAFFIESENKWSEFYKTNIGVRTDIVKMDTGNVKGYNQTNNSPADEAFFNSQDKEKTDHNYDATFTNDFTISDSFAVELGFARKSRSPNLYERYAWAGSVDSTGMGPRMDMTMINWFGDGNGYVGDIDLKPEVAHTISSSFIFNDVKSENWKLIFTPFYSEVKDFIDVDLLSSGTMSNNNYLKFANHDAVILGVDASFKAKLASDLLLNIVGNYTRGYRKDSESDLYHQMPLNGKISLEHKLGKWTNELRAHLVSKKSRVSRLRLEEETAGYALLDIGTSYQATSKLRVDLRVSNILDKDYEEALGGVDLVNREGNERNWMRGMGRSIDVAVSYDL